MGTTGVPLITVIVPVFNNPEGLRVCLTALRALSDPAYEVIVADDASTADLAPLCLEFSARHCRLPENVGPGAARNAGARMARGGILAFTDSDCAPPPDWLARIRRNLAEPGVAATAGTYGEDLSNTFFARLRLLEARHYHIRERRPVNSYISANFAIRKEVFDAVGGFPALRIGEDLLLGYRLKKAGHSVLWDYELVVSQYFRKTLWAYVRQQREWSAGALRLLLDHPEIEGMSWSVRRGALDAQIPLHAAGLAAAATAPFWPPSWIAFAACGTGIFLLNVPFLADLGRQQSAAFAARAFLAAWWIRNSAWLWGVMRVAMVRPLDAARYLVRTP